MEDIQDVTSAEDVRTNPTGICLLIRMGKKFFDVEVNCF